MISLARPSRASRRGAQGASLRLVAIILAALLLAGCSKPDTDLQAQQIAPGFLSGTVTDVALLPLAGVNVTVDGTDLSVLTDATGAFSFELLPGEYVVLATLADHERGALRASIVSGRSSALAFALDPIPKVTPRVELQEAAGYIACTSVLIVGEERHTNACGEQDPNDSPSVEFGMATLEGLDEVVLELVWEPRTKLAQALRMDVSARVDGELVRVGSAEGASPLPLRLPGRILSGSALVVTAGPAGGLTDEEAGIDGGVIAQQDFAAYASLFYWAPAPGGYSALAQQ